MEQILSRDHFRWFGLHLSIAHAITVQDVRRLTMCFTTPKLFHLETVYMKNEPPAIDPARLLHETANSAAEDLFFDEQQATILLAASGTLSRKTAAVYGRIAAAVSARFPGHPVHVKVGATAVGEWLAARESRGRDDCRRLAIVPLHLVSGREFAALEAVVDASAETAGTTNCALGRPLLANVDATHRVLAALPQSLPRLLAPDEALILVAHGSQTARAVAEYAAAAALARKIDPRLILGALSGEPRLEDVVATCHAAGFRRTWLLPFTVTPASTAGQAVGDHGPHSWRTCIEAANLVCTPLLRGLAELDVLVSFWLDQAGRLLR